MPLTLLSSSPLCGTLLPFLWLLLLVSPVMAADQPSEPFANFDDYAESALTDWKAPGLALAVIKDGEMILARGYGLCRLGEASCADENTIFPIASVTKIVTVTALARLVDRGKLDWNDRVIEHLPEFRLYDPWLTRETRIVDLVSHRTGLERADLVAYRGDCDRAELIRRLQYLRPIAPFRSRYGYHNLMVVTAGQILENVNGRSWTQSVRELVLDPLGMHSTLSDLQRLAELKNTATSHVIIDGTLQPDPLRRDAAGNEGFARLHKAVAPAGSLHSNVTDLAQFLKLHLAEGLFDGKRLLETDTVRRMQAPHSVLPIKTTPEPNFAYPRYFVGAGLGWQLRDYRGRKIVYHTGSSGAVVALMPEEKIGVAVLANRGNGIVYMVMHDVFDRLLGIPRTWTNRDWLADAEENPRRAAEATNKRLEAEREKETAPSLSLDAYTGTYTCDLYGPLEIRAEEGKLHLQFGPNIHAVLDHWEQDTFRGQLNFPPPGDWLVTFSLDDEQTVTSLKIKRIFWHEPMPVFNRIKP